MRRSTVNVCDSGSYVCVYQRDDMKQPLADVCLFDGDKSMQELITLRNALDLAIEKLMEWSQ